MSLIPLKPPNRLQMVDDICTACGASILMMVNAFTATI
jgi:hypothetical protein